MNTRTAALAKASRIRAAHENFCHDESFCRCEMFAREWESSAVHAGPVYGTVGR